MSKPILLNRRARFALDAGGFGPFVDQLHGQSPSAYRGNTLLADVAVCLNLSGAKLETDDQVADLTASNFQSMTMEVKASNDPAATILMSKTVSVFDNSLTAATWADFTKQHASFAFTDAETNIAPGTYHFVVSAITTLGAVITLGVATLLVLEDGTPSTAADPAPNPGAAITLAQADDRYAMLSDSQRGAATLASGINNKTVTFPVAFPTAPSVVLVSLALPSTGIVAWSLDQTSITTTDFNVIFGVALPNANYVLHWIAFL